jgi:hypothetical protein
VVETRTCAIAQLRLRPLWPGRELRWRERQGGGGGGGGVMMERRVQYGRCEALKDRVCGEVTCMSKNGCFMHMSHVCRGRDEFALINVNADNKGVGHVSAEL